MSTIKFVLFKNCMHNYELRPLNSQGPGKDQKAPQNRHLRRGLLVKVWVEFRRVNYLRASKMGSNMPSRP